MVISQFNEGAIIMLSFKFNKEKAIAALLYVTQTLIKNNKTPDFHKIFKIFYFADQMHLAKYGRPITGDHYIAMRNGPVPSRVYDMLKSLKSESLFSGEDYFNFFEIKGKYCINPKTEVDFDEFSESDLLCIDASINENQHLSFAKLTEKSHGKAYEKAERDDKISYQNIAKEGGADEDICQYIRNLAENDMFLSRLQA